MRRDNLSPVSRAILALAARRRTFTTADVRATLRRPPTRQHVSAAISRLVRDGALVKTGVTRGARYALPRHAGVLRQAVARRLRNVGLREDDVLDSLRRQAPFLGQLRKNVADLLAYGFLEMVNNAIEHSGARTISVELARARGQVTFAVRDTGVGVFRNVMRQRGLASELEAMQDLVKGKTTTQPESHSGQGIFFTSKAADVFVLESFGYQLRVDNTVDDYFIEETRPRVRGTRVGFQIAENSDRLLPDVFRRYQTDATEAAFDKSEIRVKLFALDTEYLSRSQARRLLAGLENFRSVILDFAGVRTIGQGFADEVFRVFRRRHPETHLIPVNMNETVRFMIERVEGA
jgi:anti-sigma regulatory factor (Ser/Thr protein kinase)